MNIKSLTALSAILFLSCSINLIAQEYKELTKTFQLEMSGEVSLENYKGSVQVETWDKGEVEVYAKIEADDTSWGGTDEEEQIEECEVLFNSYSNKVKIKTEYENRHSLWGNNTRALVHYKIKMPKTADLSISDHKSDISITGLESNIELDCYKGDMKIYDFSGAIDLESHKGRADINFSKFGGDSYFETYKGEVKVHIPKNTGFNLEVDMDHKGDFDTDFDIGERRSKKSKWHNYDDERIRCDVNGGGYSLEFSTYKGEIELIEK